MPATALVVEPFDRARLTAIVDCVTDVWVRDNVIARALGVTDEDYRPHAERVCARALEDGLGTMLRDPATDAVVGFYTAIDLVDELAIEDDRLQADANPRLRRWAELLSVGLRWYLDRWHADQPLRRGETLYYNVGGTLPRYRGQGWISRMTMRFSTEVTLARGYRRVLAIATHPRSVDLTRRLKVPSILHELPYTATGDPDLSRITEPPHALVSVTEVSARRMSML